MTYPTNYPLPTIEGYGIDVDMGVIRTQFNGGRIRQRRVYSTMPQTFTLRFVVELAGLKTWQNWVNDHAYTWFDLRIASYMNEPTEHCKEHSIRFTSNLSISPLTDDGKYFAVTVTAEQNFGTNAYENTGSGGIPPGGIVEDGDWIIGGTPAKPNDAIGPVINGHPSRLYPDTIIGGSPRVPSAVV